MSTFISISDAEETPETFACITYESTLIETGQLEGVTISITGGLPIELIKESPLTFVLPDEFFPSLVTIKVSDTEPQLLVAVKTYLFSPTSNLSTKITLPFPAP